ncbi:hypothetical protein HY450_01155 [Candidatus Pacearchaeota archaeon]|nr:hypothetical protein [Candidatus Pacearchaeota archaeon]
MTTQIEWLGEVKGLGRIARVVAPLPEQLNAFKEVGAELVDTRDVVEIRLAGVYDGFTRTSLMPVAVKGGNTILYRPSELMTPAGARDAVTTHRNGRYPIRSTDFYDAVRGIAQAEEGLEPEDRTAISVSQKGDHAWTPEMPETRFTMGRKAQRYFDEKGYKEVPYLDLIGDSNGYATVNYVWFDDPHNDSELNCRGRGLGSHNVALGVLRKTA